MQRIVSPIREMTRNQITIEDLLDRRNRELWEASAVLIDDADKTPAAKRGEFKSLITASEINRRVMKTGLMEKRANNATFHRDREPSD